MERRKIPHALSFHSSKLKCIGYIISHDTLLFINIHRFFFLFCLLPFAFWSTCRASESFPFSYYAKEPFFFFQPTPQVRLVYRCGIKECKLMLFCSYICTVDVDVEREAGRCVFCAEEHPWIACDNTNLMCMNCSLEMEMGLPE